MYMVAIWSHHAFLHRDYTQEERPVVRIYPPTEIGWSRQHAIAFDANSSSLLVKATADAGSCSLALLACFPDLLLWVSEACI